MVTRIIDIHKIKGKRPAFDIYIGRAVKYTEFNQNSIWANPFNNKLTKEEYILQNYENYIRNKIRDNPEIYNLKELVGKRLGCWCVTTNLIYPLKCHGQILLKLIKEMDLE